MNDRRQPYEVAVRTPSFNGARAPPGGADHWRHVRHRPLPRPRPLPIGLQAYPLREKRSRSGATQVRAHLGGQEWNSVILNKIPLCQYYP